MSKITVNAFIFHENRLLLINHKKTKIWMHPGGHVKENEFFDDALKREIKEEVNLDVDIIGEDLFGKETKFLELKKPFFIHGNPNNKDIALDYVCVAKEPINIRLDETELSDFKWVAEEEIDKQDMPDLLKDLIKKAFQSYK